MLVLIPLGIHFSFLKFFFFCFSPYFAFYIILSENLDQFFCSSSINAENESKQSGPIKFCCSKKKDLCTCLLGRCKSFSHFFHFLQNLLYFSFSLAILDTIRSMKKRIKKLKRLDCTLLQFLSRQLILYCILSYFIFTWYY
jgi:hypothetical protein